MGMYDTVIIPCPKCGAPVGIQSKTGECLLGQFNVDTAPEAVLSGLDHDYLDQCDKCQAYLKCVVEPQRPIVYLKQVAPPQKAQKR